MASAQVLPNAAASSRKQEHLEAGKRRLEEFRKKKASERAKKASSSSNIPNIDVSSNHRPAAEIENVWVGGSDGVTTSDITQRAVIDTSTSGMGNDKSVDLISQGSNQESLAYRTALVRNELNTQSTSLVEAHSDSDEAKRYNASAVTASTDARQNNEENKVNDIFGIRAGGLVGIPYGTTNSQSGLLLGSQDFDSNTSRSSLHGLNENYSNKNSNSSMDYTISDYSFPPKVSPQDSMDATLLNKPTNSSTSGSGNSHVSFSGGFNDSLSSKFRESSSNTHNEFPTLHGSTVPNFDSTDYGAKNSSSYNPINSMESSSRRSRSSFLDSLNVTKPSMGSPFRITEQDSSMSNNLESSSNDMSVSTYFRKPFQEAKTVAPLSNFKPADVHSPEHLRNSSGFKSNSQDAVMIIAKENGPDKKHDYYTPSKNEDFAALEQHIEDLTQEKFSLQRALEASRVLAESLAAENSSLTENYNHQRSVVNQLKLDMEKLQEDIKALLVELESLRNEYGNAQLECNAADERAKLLASEVIGLEEKALRLRSNELKLEKQLENAEAEISSYRKKISSLDKERHDMLSTIDALQEEKKVLLSKLRKASGIGKSTSQTSKNDVSTSTEDLAIEGGAANSANAENSDSAAVRDAEASSLSLVPESVNSSSGVSRVNIPHDQMRMIENINAIISELALEKEELMKALTSESSECFRMKEINKELSQKLEIQTQRLELLTAQSMVGENISGKQPDSLAMYENTSYADEGDEVVERVLGWIMKLFPAGPSRRRTSKLL